MDERAALAAIRAETNPTRRNALIGAFVLEKEALIRTLSEKYAAIEKTTVSREDIHQAGRMGFTKALETWDPEKGALSTWVGWATRRAVQDLAHAERPIKLPQIRGTTADRERVMAALRANPDATAEELGIKPGMLDRMKKTSNLRFVSVDMFGADGEDVPARARRIERKITESAEAESVDDELDQHRAARTVLDAIRRCAAVWQATVDDVIASAARHLGVELLQKTPPTKTRTKKAPAECSTPKPPTLPRPRPRPLPPPRLPARVASLPRVVARPLPRPSAPPPLRLLSAPPRPSLPRPPITRPKLPCTTPSPCCRPLAISLPRSARTCETPSTLSRAA